MKSKHNKLRGRRRTRTRLTETMQYKLDLKHPPSRPGWSIPKKQGGA